MRETPTRITVPMPPALATELREIAEATGLPEAALMRQGAIRLIAEFRETGAVMSQVLPERSAIPA